MLRPAVNLLTALTSGISNVSTVANIGQDGSDQLNKILGVGDWTYAYLSDGLGYEVVKITGIALNTISITRAQDGTIAQSFAAGTPLAYTVTIAAVNDLIAEVLLSGATVTGSGIVEITDNGNQNYTVHADPIQLISADPEIEVVSVYPNYVINKVH